MRDFSRFVGGPISRWFCDFHPHEFLIFRFGQGRSVAFCRKCLWGLK